MNPPPYDQRYIIFDSETNGLNLREGLPWQTSWIVACGERILSKHDYYPDWTAPNSFSPLFAEQTLFMPEEVQRICHFDWNFYRAKKRAANEVYDILLSFLLDPQYIIVGQNLLGFDVYMIGAVAERLGRRKDFSYTERIWDTRLLAKAWKEKIPPPQGENSLDFLRWQYKLLHNHTKTKVSQAVLLKELGIPHDPTRLHEAIYDCECSYKLFREVKKKIGL
jgi:DNA polymerase III epsilon subunit-like protein